ncbi:MFS transporter [Catellatospora methionotrophica]|uniref:MFS transporter n=1 Tax=Catellatospora methionotrophica TaxID=121620 RepID=A0A8J3PK83_9ACTN|nr:MFS transporter [Catellatospora methionotrophica]GIG18206.1 MFS transporter [Catellatospora methionotrophica]
MSDTVPTGTARRAGRREWLGLAVLGLPTLLVSLDIGALFLALPHLSADLGASSTQQLWITDIYGFLTAGFLITMGTLGDRVGRRKLLLIGAALFGVLSVVAAYATSPEMLIAARALLGIAGATLMPSTLALISNMFHDDRQRGTAIAAWVSCMMTGAALGPVIGGVMLNYFWWGAVFLLGVPVMLLLLLVGPKLLPEFRNSGAGRLDLVSVVLSLAAVLSIIYGFKELAVYGLDSPTTAIVSIVAGLVLGFLFARRQLRLDHPLLDLRLFRTGAFSALLTAMMLAAGAMAGTFLLSSQYVQSVLGLSPAEAGLWLAPTGISIAVGSQLGPILSRKLGNSGAIAGGLAVGAVGFLLIALVRSETDLALVVAGLALVHLGAGPLFALGAFLVVGTVPPERAGSAASMSETSNNFGSTLGLAVLGTIGTAVYRDQMESGYTGAAAEQARETLAGATAAAGTLEPGAASQLLTVAHGAFTSGLHTAGVIGGVVFLAMAAIVAASQRKAARVQQAPAAEPALSSAHS